MAEELLFESVLYEITKPGNKDNMTRNGIIMNFILFDLPIVISHFVDLQKHEIITTIMNIYLEGFFLYVK